MKNQQGQISPIVLWAMGIASTAFLGYSAWTTLSVKDVSADTREIHQELSGVSSKVNVNEANIANVRADLTEIKGDVKEIKNLLLRK